MCVVMEAEREIKPQAGREQCGNDMRRDGECPSELSPFQSEL